MPLKNLLQKTIRKTLRHKALKSIFRPVTKCHILPRGLRVRALKLLGKKHHGKHHKKSAAKVHHKKHSKKHHKRHLRRLHKFLGRLAHHLVHHRRHKRHGKHHKKGKKHHKAHRRHHKKGKNITIEEEDLAHADAEEMLELLNQL